MNYCFSAPEGAVETSCTVEFTYKAQHKNSFGAMRLVTLAPFCSPPTPVKQILGQQSVQSVYCVVASIFKNSNNEFQDQLNTAREAAANPSHFHIQAIKLCL